MYMYVARYSLVPETPPNSISEHLFFKIFPRACPQTHLALLYVLIVLHTIQPVCLWELIFKNCPEVS